MSGFLNKIIRGALGDILSKPKTDVGNLPVDKTDVGKPVDKTRRGIIAGGVAAPVAIGAGVLNELPVSKIIGDVVPDNPVGDVVKSRVARIVKNIGQPSKNSVINQLMDSTGFGDSFNYGGSDMKKEMGSFVSNLNKAKKYFTMKKKIIDADELDIISPNNEMAEYLEELQEEFGYTDDQILDLINETNSITKKNEGVWEDYFRGMSEGDPEFGKKYNLGTEEGDWEDWSEDDFFEKLYGSYETDIVGNTIQKAED
jgi:hypothetical protein